MDLDVIGRTGLARILDVSESTTRNLQARKLIEPEGMVDGRPLFSVKKAQQLKSARDAERANKDAA